LARGLCGGGCGECQEKKEGMHGTIVACGPLPLALDYFGVAAAVGVPTLRIEATTIA
jgi:hypothetical protein